jgi:hypothetical protein
MDRDRNKLLQKKPPPSQAIIDEVNNFITTIRQKLENVKNNVPLNLATPDGTAWDQDVPALATVFRDQLDDQQLVQCQYTDEAGHTFIREMTQQECDDLTKP